MQNNNSALEEWNKNDISVFWGEIAPTDHVVQIYEDETVVLDSLEGFVGSGLNAGDSVIIIATEKHIIALSDRLLKKKFDVDALQVEHRYIPINAHDALARFMINGWPDETKFTDLVKDLIGKARGNTNRKVRAYGEMVAILWENGHNGATVQLEHLWNKFCEKEAFCLFCAYPKSGFTQDANDSIQHICSAHTKMIEGGSCGGTEIFYKSIIPAK